MYSCAQPGLQLVVGVHLLVPPLLQQSLGNALVSTVKGDTTGETLDDVVVGAVVDAGMPALEGRGEQRAGGIAVPPLSGRAAARRLQPVV